jgi:hypothetical protein
MVGIGTIIAYSANILYFLYKEDFGVLFIDDLLEVLKMPEVQRELTANIVMSYLVSSLFFIFQLNNMLKDWKSKKSIQRPRKI